MDVKYVFLNGVLEEVYIEQRLDYKLKEKKRQGFKVKKTYYG